MIRLVTIAAAVVLAGAPRVHADTTAEFGLHGPANATVAWGGTVEVTVASSHNERMVACAFRLAVGGDAFGLLTRRTVAPALNFINTNAAAPLADGLPVMLGDGAVIEEVFLDLSGAASPGNPQDGLAPGSQVTIAHYTIAAYRPGTLTLTLAAPRAAETQSDPGGALFDTVTVPAGSADITLTVVGGPDLNLDQSIDLRDFAVLQRCLNQSPSGACEHADADADGAIDAADLAVLQGCLAGPASTAACIPPTRPEGQP